MKNVFLPWRFAYSLCILALTTLPALAQAPPTVAIHDIQGVRSTTAEVVSPYAGQSVKTTGIVTAITGAGFFIQTPDGSADSNPLTPEGIYVYTGTGKVPSSVAIGNSMQVTGMVATFPALNTTSHIPSTEIETPTGGTLTITQLATGQPLPAPIQLTAANLTTSGGIYQLTPYEGMRVSFSSLTAISGTGGSLNEASETYTSNGQFYAVITGTARPFRKPGIDLRDAPVPGAPPNIAVFDDNPERIFVDSGFLAGSTPINVSTGAILPNVTGVLDFSDSYDDNYVPARLLVDPSYSTANITAGMTVQPLVKPLSTQFTVAAFNVERFYNTSATDDLYYVPAGVNGYNGNSSTPILSTGQTFQSAAVDVTSAAYQRRLQKVSLAVRTVLNTPDIVALEEVENQSVANDIAAQINTDAGVPNLYTAYSTDNSTFYTQDGTGISVGFLIKNSTVEKLGFEQLGAAQTFVPAGASTPITLNDRPWLAIQAGIKRANAKDYNVIVIVNHLKSLSGVNSTTSSSTRQKKELQAEDISAYIQTLQAAHQPVISAGDFNAFEFSDGYTDTLATYTNTNVLPATQVVQPGVAGLVTPPLVDLALQIPQNQRWSYDEFGNAQILDHIVVTQDLATTAQFAYAHLDADFPVVDYNDATTPARTSDHDAAVGYFAIPAPVLGVFLSPSTASFTSPVGVASTGQAFTLSNVGEAPFTVTSIAATGDFAESNNCGASGAPLAIGASCTVNVVFTPTAAGARTGSLSVLTSVSGTPQTASLTGTGSDFTLTDSAGKTATTVSVAAGSNGTATLVFTPAGGFNAAIATACVAQGTAPTGVTCTAPATFTLSGTAAVNQTVSFSTTSRVKTGGIALGSATRSSWPTAFLLALTGLLMLLAGRTRRLARRIYRIGGLLALLLAVLLPAIGCGGKGSSNSNPGGTPAGSYNYTVTASSGTLSHTETVTLVVQ